MGNRGRGQRVRAHLSARGGSAVVLQVERAGGGGCRTRGGDVALMPFLGVEIS
jgi:hypothetical protein